MAGRRVLVLLAHPVLERSRVNRRLLEAVRDLDAVTVHDLYEVYPTLAIDVRREQRLLVEHDVVVFQHPFYWYSMPSILKEWQDLVLEHGGASGAGGTRLCGKISFHAISTGAPASAYRRDGYNRFTVRELLVPCEQTEHLCGMRTLAPFVVHAALRLGSADELAPHQAAYRRLIEAVRDGRLDLDRAAAAANLNDELEALLAPREVA
jgi:glutathione-regulated potassium-efflux system ancillary protein KefG